MPPPLVTVGLVTWNSANFLDACLGALREQKNVYYDLIVMDNASIDSSVDIVRRYYPDATLICNSRNTGFCSAHNLIIGMTHGMFYMPLNPDAVMKPDYISQMVSVLEEKPEYGSAASKLLRSQTGGEDSIIDSTGLYINRQRQQFLRGYGEEDHGQFDRPGEVFGVDGAAPLYRRKMLEDIQIKGQYFDESFFIHKEDVDLSWRARLLGWRCWYTPEAVAVHPRTFRPGQKRDVLPLEVRVHAVKNRYLLLKKNESPQGWRRDGLPILWYDLKILVYLCFFERSSLKAFSLLRQFWPQASEWRREIWKRARVDPNEMLGWFK
jgi:GT2 family glycosyltransferase